MRLWCRHVSADTSELERITFASLRMMSDDNFQFVYSPGESDATTFPSELLLCWIDLKFRESPKLSVFIGKFEPTLTKVYMPNL